MSTPVSVSPKSSASSPRSYAPLAGRWAELTRKIETDPACRRGWEKFDARMREFNEAKVAELRAKGAEYRRKYQEHGGPKVFTWTNFLRFMGKEATELAFHHRMTGHENSRRMAEDLLQFLMEAEPWQAIDPKRGWHSDLWVAEVTASSALAMLILGDTVEKAQRQEWERTLFARGVEPILRDWMDPVRRIHALDTMGHNWWSVCVPCAAMGLLAGPRSNETEDWLQRIGDGLVEFFQYPGNVLENKRRSFGAQGDFIEPVGYLDYALLYPVLMFDFYPECAGRDLVAEIPVLARLGDYCLASVQVLEDGDDRLAFGDVPGRLLSERAAPWLWVAGRFRNEPLFHYLRRNRPEPGSFYEFLHWPAGLAGESFQGAPRDIVFEQVGEGILRDGYDTSSTVFAIKTGDSWNHNHIDAGSFVLSSAGRHFLIDSGTCEYSSPFYLNYFMTPDAHNVILPGGRKPEADVFHLGVKHEGTIPCHLFAPGYKYLLADATGPWEGVHRRFYRHVMWIDDFIVMVDDLMAWQPGKWTQLLHHAGTALSDGRRTRIENGGQVLTVHHVVPNFTGVETRTGQLKVQEIGVYKEEQHLREVPYFALHCEGPEVRQKFVQVFELPGKSLEAVEPIEADRLSGVRVRRGRTTWEIFCNHAGDGRMMNHNAHATFGEFRSDAFLVALRRDAEGTLTAAALHHGSYLRRGDEALFSSLLKGNVLINYDDAVLHSFSSAETWADLRRPEEAAQRVKLPPGATRIQL